MKTNKLKILLFCTSTDFSGAEKVVYYLARKLSKYKFLRVSILVNKEILKYYKPLIKFKIKIIHLKYFPIGNFITNRFKIGRSVRELRGILNKCKFDLVHVHMPIPPEFFNEFNRIKLPYVFTFHGTELVDFTYSKKIIQKLIFNPIYLRIFRKSRKLTSVFSWSFKDLKRELVSKIVVIPNGVDSRIFKPLKNIKQKKNVILFAGRFIGIKGIKEILEVAKQLTKYEFWFAGEGPLANLIERPNTKNLGFKSTEELVKLYNQATICIFPSYTESFGLVGLEAMSCGRAVIATPLGFSEYIENGKDGIIIPAKDEVALKNAIVNLMTNEKKRKMLEKNAREKALKYSWDKVAEKYLEVFKEVVKSKK
ncbi:MAG: glycosyltransferase family 4 protein [Candidatus Pacearchaeota archaeon]|nr:glycosyltransferase family 4 protein [Candidatus Pacearchaeota archaeon]